jgi:hypothetical protein
MARVSHSKVLGSIGAAGSLAVAGVTETLLCTYALRTRLDLAMPAQIAVRQLDGGSAQRPADTVKNIETR